MSDAEPLPPHLPAVAAAAARRWPEQAAVIAEGRTASFAEIHARMRAAASAFIANGVRKGDVIAIWAPNQVEWIIAALGAQAAGAVLTPLNTRLKGREAGDILRRSRARLLFTVLDFLGTDYPALIAGEDLPELARIIAFDDDGPDGFAAFLAAGSGAADPRVDAALAQLGSDDPCDILFTSGTTGSPKGVVSTHGQTVRLFDVWGERAGVQPGDRLLIINPFFHTFGYKAGWLACFIRGATALPLRTFEPAQVADLIRTQGVSILPGPPTIFQMLLAEQQEACAAAGTLRVAVTGAATVPPILVQRMQQELGFKTVITGYGMTECGVISMCRAGDSIEQIATTCGVAAPGLEICCVDEQGKRLAPGETGELLVRGFGVMRGYLDDPEATKEAIDADGWLHTGDVGTMDADGYIRITDRKKDMYITGGFNCYPAEIEKLLSDHPKVAMAAVVGVPDDRLGEVGKAFIVPRRGQTVSAEEIIAWSRQNMANYKVPRSVELCEALPRNAAGKVVRHALKLPGGTPSA
ncbi:FadD3 family acyl-CoA ligase [Xanthobacter wiegelii]|uniref:FadD3 family acyl-CoA ligase n=1 Tax=Xanthobacter wiegelii TaxID=3119913 RepID=UPI00372A3F88